MLIEVKYAYQTRPKKKFILIEILLKVSLFANLT